MAFFAEINENNIVIRVISIDDIHESDGSNWCNKNLGGVWVETSYTNHIRKQYAGIGFTYDETADEFVAPSPFPSWTLDANNDWQAPVPQPEGDFYWNESTLSWVVGQEALRLAEVEAKASAKASAQAKLKALGLSDAEVEALVG